MAGRQDQGSAAPDRAGGRADDMEIRQGAPSLARREAAQIRNEQRGGHALEPRSSEEDPEANATLRKVWSEPGGEAANYRNSRQAAGTKADDHGDLTAAETPATHRHVSDATLGPQDKDATAVAVERMGMREAARTPRRKG